MNGNQRKGPTKIAVQTCVCVCVCVCVMVVLDGTETESDVVRAVGLKQAVLNVRQADSRVEVRKLSVRSDFMTNLIEVSFKYSL